MPTTPAAKALEELTLERTMIGVLALLSADRDDRLNASTGKDKSDARRKTEVVLADAGLSQSQIGALLNKNVGTVGSIISRARSKGSKDGNGATSD